MSVSLVMHQKVKLGLEEYEVKEGNTVKYKAKKKLLAAGADFDIFDAMGNKIGLVDQKVLNMKESLPEVRREYEALQKELVKKAEIDTAITTGEARLKKLEELIPEREQRLNELQKEIDQKEDQIRYPGTCNNSSVIIEIKSYSSDLYAYES